MKDVAELLRGVAAVLWPVIVLIVVLNLRSELVSLVSRVRKAKVLGQELELDKKEVNKALDHLQVEVETLAKAPPTASMADPELRRNRGSWLVTTPGRAEDRVRRSTLNTFNLDLIERQILGAAARSPRLALMMLSSELEKALRKVLSDHDLDEGIATRPESSRETLDGLTELLHKRGKFNPTVVITLKEFSRIRNRLVHLGEAVSDDEILRAIDLGLVILRVIYGRLPYIAMVEKTGIELFDDEQTQTPRQDIHGVVIQSISPSGQVVRRKIYPTKKEYEPGETVGLSFNSRVEYGPCWYREAEGQPRVLAWEKENEFTGLRHFEL